MGYTHYWSFRGEVAPKDIKDGKEKFTKAYELINKAYKKVTEMGIEIAGGDGNGKPTITPYTISFNGKGEKSHETFFIRYDVDGWNFCKTARKPYDVLVCLSLLAFKEAFGDDFEYSSDGVTRESLNDAENIKHWKSIGLEPKVEEEWETAYKVWDELMA